MGKKKGPPYLDKPDEQFVVIVHPWRWGMHERDETRGIEYSERDFACFWEWLTFVFGNKFGVVSAVYMRSKREEVIAEISSDVNIVPHLGAHKASNFLRNCPPRDAGHVSYIFEYNYRSNGNPTERQWHDKFPKPMSAMHRPIFKEPYPLASWAQPPRGDPALSQILLPLPQSRTRTPSPPPRDPTPPARRPSTPPAQIPTPPPPPPPPSQLDFEPYEPAPHHPSHPLSHYTDREDDVSDQAATVKPEPVDVPLPTLDVKEGSNIPAKLLYKADPYEQEEIMNNILKQEDVAVEYRPSEELLASFATLSSQKPVAGIPNSRVKSESEEDVKAPLQTPEYHASQELVDAITHFQSNRRIAPASDLRIKREITESSGQFTTSINPDPDDTMSSHRRADSYVPSAELTHEFARLQQEYSKESSRHHPRNGMKRGRWDDSNDITEEVKKRVKPEPEY